MKIGPTRLRIVRAWMRRDRSPSRQPRSSPILVAWLLAGACSSGSSGAVDAQLAAAPDARSATPDARPDTPDGPRGAPDAQPATPDAAIAALRPWSGATASARAVDLQLLSAAVGTKICLFGDDGDPRPFAVLADRSHDSAELTWTVPATYVATPAGVPLRLQRILTFQPPDASPTGCDVADSDPLPALKTGEYYTIANTNVDNFFADCDTASDSKCAYFPKSDAARPDAMCATGRAYLIDDGDGTDTGWRVLNLTTNAASIAATTAPDIYGVYANVDLDPTRAGRSFELPTPGETTLRVCPAYLDPCLVPPLAPVDAPLDIDSCTNGDAAFTLGTVASSRLGDANAQTTFYIVGNAKPLSTDTTQLLGPDIVVVVAHDAASP
jgi:hypothetical protein